MKNFLNYQTSEYDCGPTTILNGIRFLFEREEIPPTLIKGIMMYGNDTFNDDGEAGKRGTTKSAIKYMACWLTGFSKGCGFPIKAEYVIEEETEICEGSKTMNCLKAGGAALMFCWTGGYGHYVLLTGIDGDCIELFDPYYEENLKLTMEEHGAIVVEGKPRTMNRLVKMEVLNRKDKSDYAMGDYEKRVNLLMWNTAKKEA